VHQDVSALEGVEIVVPGSIGNMGPGFDALSLAVQLYLRIRVVSVIDDGRGRLECEFADCTLLGPNRIERTFACMRAKYGAPLPSLQVEVRTDIPLRAGLGSSAAAVVGAMRLFERLTGPMTLDAQLRIATDIEGHPDNAASALCGGLAGCCEHQDGRITAWSWRWPERIKLIVATPAVPLETAVARKVLPERVTLHDAVFNLQHALLLLHALESGDRALIREAIRDRWHQPARQLLVPGLEQLLALDDPDILGVCLSGSGPSVVALADDHFDRVATILTEAYQAINLQVTVRTLSAHQRGQR
jgi:homoserine kinase